MNGRTGPLERAITYAARSVLDVTPALLPRPTPCRGWNLDMLLRHASESLAALHDGTVTRHIALIPAAPDRAPAADPAQTFRDRAGRLLAAQATADGWRQALDIADLPLPAIAMECAGAIEIAVHGWDISQACGQHRPIPDTLAASLLAIAPLLIPETGRAPPVQPASHANSPRQPGRPAHRLPRPQTLDITACARSLFIYRLLRRWPSRSAMAIPAGLLTAAALGTQRDHRPGRGQHWCGGSRGT